MPSVVDVGQSRAGSLEDDWKALVALYQATDGPNWVNNDNWKPNLTVVPAAEELATWYGVDVDESAGRVRSLKLPNNNLVGSLPPDFGNLTAITHVNLQSNAISSAIPLSIHQLAELHDLRLSDNQLEGQIPDQLGNLTELDVLLLDHNLLSGSIPHSLGNLVRLTDLRLHSNQLTGSIPPELGNLTELGTLYANDNRLSGVIPSSLGNLVKLTDLRLNSNRLTGEIPPELGNLTELGALSLESNALSGNIPSEFGRFERIEWLRLNQNQLDGSIPAELGGLRLLKRLRLEYNALVGSIPREFGNLPRLESLSLNNNRLTGEMPPELGDLATLKSLEAKNNQLEGHVPDAFGRLRQLQHLSIENNRLIGKLPRSITGLKQLDHMHFQGQALCAPSDAEFRMWADTVEDWSGPFCRTAAIAAARAVESAGSIVFAVSLGFGGDEPLSLNYSTRGGTATEGADYARAEGQLTFMPDETQKLLHVPLLDDTIDEPDETFVVELSGPDNVEFARSEGVGTIEDDDARTLAVVSSVRVGEADGQAQFAVTLNSPSSFEITVAYATADGTAYAGADYEEAVGTLRIPAGETTRTIIVPILDDNIWESEEAFTLELSGAQNAILASATATGIIVDDEVVPTFSIGDVTVAESAGSAVFTVTLSGPSAHVSSVEYGTEDETATAGADYAGTRGKISLDPGQLAREIVVPLIEDEVEEPEETFLVRLSNPDKAEVADGAGRGTITDDDAVTISIYDARATEDAGILHLPVRLSRKSARTVSVHFESSDMEAEAGSDYTASRGIVIFEQGSTEGAVAIAITDDALDEENETFEVTLSRPLNAVIARGTAAGTIADNDGAPLLRVGDITAIEEAGAALFVVSLSAPTNEVVTASYRTIDGTAKAGADYVETAGTLVFAPGEVEKEVPVSLLQDGRDWRQETFSLVLVSATHARLEDASAQATIVEEESVEEGAMAAHLARFARTSASHVVAAVAERLMWREAGPVCYPAARDYLVLMRQAGKYQDWSAAELLSGCALATGGSALGVWGRGAFTRIRGQEGALTLRSDVATGALGADYRLGRGLAAGLLLARSRASGTFDAYAAEGETGAVLTGVYPYASYDIGTSSIWGLAGLGRGSSEVGGAETLEARLGSRLMAAGAAGTVARGSRSRLSYIADAFLARAEAKDMADVQVSRLRAGLEGSTRLGRSLRPYLETAIRHDGGDAEKGMGLEMGGGVRLGRSGSRLRGELRSRTLLMHAAEHVAEWGAAAAVYFGRADGQGPTAEIHPGWGTAASGGMRALFLRDTVADAAVGPLDERQIEVRLGYGTPLTNPDGVARPHLAVVMSGAGRDYHVGYEVRMRSGLAFYASGTAREIVNPWHPVVYGCTVRASLGW